MTVPNKLITGTYAK